MEEIEINYGKETRNVALDGDVTMRWEVCMRRAIRKLKNGKAFGVL